MTFVLVQHLSLRPQPTHASIPALPKPALSLPSVPSIAVLPFANLSGDPQQEYFSDGITDDLITDLSRVPNLFVIARTSTFTYKGKAERAQSIGRELGVKYLLEGSARKAGDQLRINVRLINATSGNQVWASRYDREMRDIFQLQDQIVGSLTTTLGLQLPILEKGAVITQRTDNLEAYDYLLRGYAAFFDPTPDALANAATMFEKAMALDRRYADAYSALAFVNWVEYAWQWDSDPHPLDRAEELARKAVFLDESNAEAHAVRGLVAALKSRVDEAIADGQRAVALNPNSAFNYQALSDIYNWVGKPGAALTAAYKGLRLDPNHPDSYALQIGSAYNALWRYTQALTVLQAGLAANEGLSNNPWVHVALIETYSELGHRQDARLQATEVMRVAPKFSLEAVKRRYATCDCQTDQHFYDNLREAGLS
jgi:adenylate cyclase